MNQSLQIVTRTVCYSCRYKDQATIAEQQIALKAHAHLLGLTIIGNYTDNVSTFKLEERLQLNELMKAAIRKEFDCVLIYKFTAFAASIPHLLHVLKQFFQLDIRIISLHDGIDTKGEMGRDTIYALQTLIQLKEALIRERTQEGLRKARAKGKKLGRPVSPVSPKVIKLVEELAETTNLSIKKIREETGKLLSYQATRNIIHRIRNQQ